MYGKSLPTPMEMFQGSSDSMFDQASQEPERTGRVMQVQIPCTLLLRINQGLSRFLAKSIRDRTRTGSLWYPAEYGD